MSNLPDGWQLTPLGDIADFINGRGFKPHEWGDVGLPIIRIQNLNGDKKFNYYNGEYDPKILIKPGDLLFAWSGSRGTSFGPHFWHHRDGLLNYHTWKVDHTEEADHSYLFYSLKNITTMIEHDAHGAAGLVHTQKNVIVNYSIPLPPLPEQRAIAAILSTWDEAITLTEALIKALQHRKQALMQLLLTGAVRFQEFEGSEWEVAKLGDVATVKRGASPRPINDPKWFSENGRAWVRIADVNASPTRFLNEASQYLSSLGEALSVKVEVGDLIMSIAATIGVPKIVNIPACIHDGFVLFKNYECKVDKEFLYHYLSMQTKLLVNSGQPGTQKNINSEIVREIEIPLVTVQEQQNIANVLNLAEDEVIYWKNLIKHMQTQKRALMQQLLTGAIRVPGQE